MKKVLLIVAAILLASAVSAQNYEKNILGVRAGLNLSSLSLSESGVSLSSDSRASFHVAVVDQILLCNRLPFYLETGLAFSSRGGKLGILNFRPSYIRFPYCSTIISISRMSLRSSPSQVFITDSASAAK